MEQKTKNQIVLKLGISFVVIYWLITTILSTFLAEDSGFISSLINPTGWYLVLRIIPVVCIIAVTVYLHLIMKQQSLAKENLDELLNEWNYLIEAANFPVIELDSQHRIKSVNKTAAILTGYTEDDLMLQDFAKGLFFPDDHQQVKTVLDPSYTAKTKKTNLVFQLKTKRHKNCYINLTTSFTTKNNEVDRILVFLQDISTPLAKQTTAENQLLTITNSVSQIPLPIAILTQTKVKLWNNSIADLTGISCDDINMDNLNDYVNSLAVHKQIQAAIEQVYSNRESTSIDFQARHRLNFIPTGEGENLATLIWVEDITAINQVKAMTDNNNQLEQQLKDLEEKQQNLVSDYRREQTNTVSLTNQIAELQEQNNSLKSEQIKLEQEVQDLGKLEEQFNQIKLPIFQVDQAGLIKSTNQTGAELLGLVAATSLLPRLASGEQRNSLLELLAKLEPEKTAGTELEFSYNNQTIIVNCYLDLVGENEILIYGHDITAFHKTQRELALSLDTNRFELDDLLNEMEVEREKTNVIMSNVSEGIIVTDVYNRVVKMNPAAEDLLGIRLSQALERPIHFVIRNQEILDHLKTTIKDKLYNHHFTLEINIPGEASATTLTLQTSLIQDRNLQEQGTVIKLTS